MLNSTIIQKIKLEGIKLKFIDLFAGIGGFRKGMEFNGHKCVLSCEIDTQARKSYSAIYNESNDFPNDVRKLVEKKELPEDYDVLCAGFPCQPFSRAGRREGFKSDKSGNLFFSIMDIIDNTNPNIVFLENVKGLLTSGIITEPTESKNGINPKYVEIEKGLTFKIILEHLNSHGYDVQWQLISSAHFIAHKRERVYIIATKRNNTLKRIFPIHSKIDTIRFDNNLFKNMLEDESFNFIKKESNIFKLNDKNILIDMETKKEFEFKSTTPWRNFGLMINGNILTSKVKHNPETIYKLSELLEKDVDNKHILTKEEEEKQRVAKSPKTWKSGNKMGRMSFPDNIDKPCRTLTANSSGREMMVLPYKGQYRKLTAKEYYRLQGFTDKDYDKAIKAGVSESQIKKQAGNAVTVSTIKAIVGRF